MRFLIIGPFWEQAGSAARASRAVPKNKPNRAIAIAVIHFVASFTDVFINNFSLSKFKSQMNHREPPQLRRFQKRGSQRRKALDQKRTSAEEQRIARARRRAVIIPTRLDALE